MAYDRGCILSPHSTPHYPLSHWPTTLPSHQGITSVEAVTSLLVCFGCICLSLWRRLRLGPRSLNFSFKSIQAQLCFVWSSSKPCSGSISSAFVSGNREATVGMVLDHRLVHGLCSAPSICPVIDWSWLFLDHQFLEHYTQFSLLLCFRYRFRWNAEEWWVELLRTTPKQFQNILSS